jgi:hypothetical protein
MLNMAEAARRSAADVARPLSCRRRVRNLAATLGFLVPALLAGCTLGGPETIYPSEGYPTLGAAQTTRPAASSLVVSTPTYIDLNLGDPDDGAQVRPTGYTLYDEQGKKMMYVRNYVGNRGSEPLTLQLDPGKYLVLLDKPEGQPAHFWVKVEPGKLTRVDLAK